MKRTLSENNLRKLVLETGKPLSDIRRAYVSSLKEADLLGVPKSDTAFLIDCIKIHLNIDKNRNCFLESFIESEKNNVNDFIEELYDEEGEGGSVGMTVSTDFANSDRPENVVDTVQLKKKMKKKSSGNEK